MKIKANIKKTIKFKGKFAWSSLSFIYSSLSYMNATEEELRTKKLNV